MFLTYRKQYTRSLLALWEMQFWNLIKNEIKAVKFYSIVVDSTPDVSHCDQLAIIFRYLNDDQPVERFIKYIPAVGHKAKEMEEAVLKTINDLDIRIDSPTAKFVPCSAHSLNLIGLSAAGCCQEAIYFFCTVDKVYNFFSASTGRWLVLEKLDDC